MKSIRNWIFTPFVVILALGILTSGAWARHAGRQSSYGRSGPLDEADQAAKKALLAHDIGNVRMTMSNFGELGNPDGVPGFKGFEFPINSGNDFIFSTGLWIGAEVNGIHHVSTCTDGDNGTAEYYPVHVGTVPISRFNGNFQDWYTMSKSFTSFNGNDYNQSVKCVDDDGDWNAATDDLDHNGVPSCDWDGPLLDANLDGDLTYDPEPHLDEDSPGDNTHYPVDSQGNPNPAYVSGAYDDDGDGLVDEDGRARGTQEYYATYQDMISPQFVSNPDPEDPHTPNTWLHVVVNQRSFAFPELYASAFILVNYHIKNVGQLPLNHVYIAVFCDADIAAAGETGDAASLNDSTWYDSTNFMMVTNDNCCDANGLAGGLGIRVVQTPKSLDSLKLTYANFERVSGGDPPTDADKYNLMASGQIAPASNRYGDWRMLIAFGDRENDGFQINPGQILPITVAYVGGLSLSQISQNAAFSQPMFVNDFQGPSAPDPPVFDVVIAPSSTTIRWASNSEGSVDAITKRHDFEGYTIERSTDQVNWQTIVAYDIVDRVDTLHVPNPLYPNEPDSFLVVVDTTALPFEWQNFNLGMPADRGNLCPAPLDSLRGEALRYCYEDAGLAPGHTYYYVVRAFDKGAAGAGILYSGRTGHVVTADIARAGNEAPKDLKQVYVFPNPYKGSHPGEQGGQVNPSKGLVEFPRKLYFMGLPADGTCIIRIFSLAGDHLQTIYHSSGVNRGTEFDQWDLVTKNKQEIVSGIYFYTIEYTPPGGKLQQSIDKFVVIK